MKVRFLPEAEAEHLDHVAWFERQVPGLGARYLADVDETLARIAEAPHRMAQLDGSGIRRALLRRFPYALYYAIRDQAPLIIAVAAHRRRPRYWSSRLRNL